MARQMDETTDAVYRAVVEVAYTRDGEPRKSVQVFGPYVSVAPAKVALKGASHQSKWFVRYYDDVVITGHIEKAATVWEPVP